MKTLAHLLSTIVIYKCVISESPDLSQSPYNFSSKKHGDVHHPKMTGGVIEESFPLDKCPEAVL